ncbi:DUF1778 domain-containing protein [Nocardiopsis algeriensis]|uniref:Uncharacterized protein (DUF1778 family) n=1 Tax=Nocardiopsis algeriensis TaxID=1478215 RepID=A0A841IR54_9ACTN|nr:DUF1778 domain-containing protein [Nocardiopsis algeriensis]MBB6120690.1 uncharacterized protein (DUF1778 family) [Nocardiopsis algeriensis]
MSTATERMEVRLTPEDRALLLEAARISHESASKFVVRAAREAAKEVMERERTTTVPAAFFDAMVESLEEPAQPIEELASAVRRHRSVVKR